METPHNTLPTREQLKFAIDPWWRGGGTTDRIIDCLRRMSSNVEEAKAVAMRLTVTAEKLNFIPDAAIEEAVEIVRAVGRHHIDKEDDEAKSPTPPIGSPEWYRRATERAKRNAWAENPYKNWTWEKPKAQRRST